jgi:ATP-dependent Lhr-like helicase
MTPSDSSALDLFLPPVRDWFLSALGQPTPAQKGGWPLIASRRNTLILAPTGSGKTLAAFLACLDFLWRQEKLLPGIKVLYISPLKALNNDIHRNLQIPLAGILEFAARKNTALPALVAAVRTGDTSQAERQRLIRQPPHILITTPESLHLLLTSRARETLRGLHFCIVDEIHALCPNKRGVFLSLLLERLEALNPQGFTRIGLSATQRPLAEVARYLGGLQPRACDGAIEPRPVAIVDAGLRKGLDLQVICPVDQFGALPEKSVWPSIYRFLRNEIEQHRSTIVFANNRRSVERITAQLNEKPGQEPANASPVNPFIRAHHGSVSLEVRQATEQALKEGRLKAVATTASLELGIDMGAVDLVCQVESPGNVARGLQRVGRAGHLVGSKSKGRLIAKTPGDLLEHAVLAAEMVHGRVEEIRVPANCLDVLAQQVVAMTAMDPWDVPALFSVIRRAYPYRDLTPHAFETVLEMVTGRSAALSRDTNASNLPPAPQIIPSALQPRISWDRVHNRLHALPGSQRLALVNGGTIPDTGQYAAYTITGVRIGELDEEFVYERRLGDTFLLGTNAWRLEQIEADRVVVAPASGAPAMVPFWRGEQPGRSYDLGLAIGKFLRELSSRLDDDDCISWLEQQYFLNRNGAKNLVRYVRRQLRRTNCLPTDSTLMIEASRDQLGDWQVVLLSPFGARLHFSLRLAIENALRRRLGYSPQCFHHDDGILIRLADSDEPVMDLLTGITPENVRDLILEELADSALFALRFRQNAARALLLARSRAGRRAPLWLQRLRGKDLLQLARRQADFPIVVETFRECLHDHLDVDHLRQLLADIQVGQVNVVTRRLESPSPFASELLFAFVAAFMYQYDDADGGPGGSYAQLDRQLLDQLVAPERAQHLLDPRAVHQVERRLRGLGIPPRTPAEMAEWLRRIGDLAETELEGPTATFARLLEAEGVATSIELPDCRDKKRWILVEEADTYRSAFLDPAADPAQREAAAVQILNRFLETHALVSLSDVLDRYPFEPTWAQSRLEQWAKLGRAVAIPPRDAEPMQWSAPANFGQIQRGTLGILRREIITCPAHQFADFILHWQFVIHDPEAGSTVRPLDDVLDRLQVMPLPAELWEQAILPARLHPYQPVAMDDAIASGQWTWVCRSEGDAAAFNLAFVRRDSLGQLPPPAMPEHLDSNAHQVLGCLQNRGALFTGDVAQAAGLPPSAVRAGLWTLMRHGLVANDHYDVVRRGPQPAIEHDSAMRRRGMNQPEGRWWLLPWARPSMEDLAIFFANVLLVRYGIVARELAAMDFLMPPWRILYEVLSRMELAGQIRRGYFAEGLSGAQFALPEAARLLQERCTPSTAADPVVLIHSQDPANMYGFGAPLALSLDNAQARTFSRRAGNFLVVRGGKPILAIEQQGRRLTTLPAAGHDDIRRAVACLPRMLHSDRGLDGRSRLTVEEWNGRSVTATPGRELLEAVGFVRDYQSMTYYAGVKPVAPPAARGALS